MAGCSWLLGDAPVRAAGAARRRALRRAPVDDEPGEPRARGRGAARMTARPARHPHLVPRRRRDGAGRPPLVDFVAEHAGRDRARPRLRARRLLRALADRGFDVRASTSCPSTSSARARSGCDAELYDGERLPLDDGSVDTVFLLEVLEHLEDPAALLREARRVARRNVLVTTPNCTQDFGEVPVEFSHMLDVDHRQFFTVTSLRALLDDVFGSSRGGADRPAGPPPRRAPPAAAAAAALPLARQRRARRSRATSSACAGARPPAHDARALRLRRARRPAMAGPAIRVARAGPRARAALRGHAGRARAERRRRRARRRCSRPGSPTSSRCWRPCARTTSSSPSGSRRSSCATSRACRSASWPTSTTRR